MNRKYRVESSVMTLKMVGILGVIICDVIARKMISRNARESEA
jgi:hypothetical protein